MMAIDLQLVNDVNPEFSGMGTVYYPDRDKAVEMNGSLYFVGESRTAGLEVWRSDGTPESTYPITDITPDDRDPRFSPLINMGGTLFFLANGKLWRSDGTTSGTTLVSSKPLGARELVQVGDKMFFIGLATSSSPANTTTLWVTDGTDEGTTLVRELTSDVYDGKVRELTDVDGTLYFTAAAGGTGYELWKSDGTADGTVPVRDINLSGNSNPKYLTNVDGTLYFSADNGISGAELWRSNGTAAGTWRVADINTGSAASAPSKLTAVGSNLFFTADDGETGVQLFRSDGTEAGTIPLLAAPGTSQFLDKLTNVSGTLLFAARDNEHGVELWRSDGSAAGTELVKDIAEGTASSSPDSLMNVDGVLYFGAGPSGAKVLWRSDGTTAGTVQVMSTGSYAIPLGVASDMLYFAERSTSSPSLELWKLPSTGNAQQITNHVRGKDSSPTDLGEFQGQAVFWAAPAESQPRQLWLSDGTPAGTRVVPTPGPGSGAFEYQGHLYFSSGTDLYRSDGSSPPVFVAKLAEHAPYQVTQFITVGGLLYFEVLEDHNSWLRTRWRSDGTTDGTFSLTTTDSAYDEEVLAANGLLFIVRDSNELWKTDGTQEGTIALTDLGSSFFLGELANVNGTVYFQAHDELGPELWRTDGTPGGTELFKELTPGSAGSTPRDLTNFNGTLYFNAWGEGENWLPMLWKSDGTPEGTTVVYDPGFFAFSDPRELTVVNDTLFYVASETFPNGEGDFAELWKTDASGVTQKVLDIRPGSGSSYPNSLINVGGRLFFLANDGSGETLWYSNGTAEGTRRVADTKFGLDFANLTNIGGTLYFVGTDTDHGQEVWRAVVTPSAEVTLGPAVGYRENAASILLAPNASIVEPDGAVGEYGHLAVFFTANGQPGDVVSVRHQGAGVNQIGIVGVNITFSGEVIGSFSGGTDGSSLSIDLNDAASTPAVRALLRNLTFKSSSDRPAGNRTIKLVLSTDGGNLSTAKQTIVVEAVNDAPVLSTDLYPQLAPTPEDSPNPASTLVSSLLTNAVTDPDANALRGIAVSGASNYHGTWQFSTNGGTSWQAMGEVSEAAARLLPGWSRVRFVPNADFHGTVKLYYRAWDQTQGMVGGTFDVRGNLGGTKAFSTAYESAALTVKPVNDPPRLVLGGTLGYVRDTAAITLAAGALVSDVDSANFQYGRLRVRITDGASTSNRLAIGGGFTVDATGNVLQGTTIIGRRVGHGWGTSELVIAFNANATPTVAQQLAGAITFKTAAGAAGKRTILFTISDGAGGVSGEAVKTVEVR